MWELILDNPSSFVGFKDLMSTGLNNILNIINLVGEMRSLDDKKHSLNIRQSNLKKLIKRSHDILDQKLVKKNIALDIDVDDQITVLVEETSFVNSVVNNLITNAIKFSFSGSRVFVTAKEENDRVKLMIRDFGIGMPKEILDIIFDENKKTNRIGTDGEHGTGYGMPLAKKFINTYGGEIEVISRQEDEYPNDHGTEIRIELKNSK